MIAVPSPVSLMVWVDGHVGEVGTVEAVREHPPGADEDVVGVGEAGEHAVAEHRRERFRRLVAKWRDPVQAGEFLQVHGGNVMDPGVVIHRALRSSGLGGAAAMPYGSEDSECIAHVLLPGVAAWLAAAYHAGRARRCQAGPGRGLSQACRAADADDHLAGSAGGALCPEGCWQVGQPEDRRDRRAQPLAADQRGQFA
jgi:hypothetical protein